MKDQGSVSVLMLALLGLAGLLCLATADAANVLLARARAQAAADAAALAAAQAQWPLESGGEEPAAVARLIAEANGTELESCECTTRSARATVTVSRRTNTRMLGVAPRRVTATAQAETSVGRLFAPREE